MLTLKCVSARTLQYFSHVNLVVVENLVGRVRTADARCYSVHKSLFKVNEMAAPLNSFKFNQYDCLGFDLDNTVCRYKVSNMVKMEYKCIVDFLVEKRGYSDKYLKLPIESNVDFMIKGLILDVKKGNILRIAPNGTILHGSHGTKELTKTELTQYYGNKFHWEVTDTFTKDPLHTWNGPLSQSIRTLLDYFDMPAGLVFARAVDTLDEQNGGKLDEYDIYTHIFEALQDMFIKDHFQTNEGGYFPLIKANPHEYIHKCSDRLINWLKQLKAEKKTLFLITGSNIDFASHTASNSIGPNWKDLFDIIICYAKKPGFFTQKRPFMGLDGFMETHEVAAQDLQRGAIYTCGNWEGLQGFLKRASGLENPKVIYMGDNLIQDIYTPSVHGDCDTVAVCEELEAEGVFGHECNHFDDNFLVSNTWGSYFHHETENNSTIWKDIINKHSKLCIPSLEYAAQFPIDHDYYEN